MARKNRAWYPGAIYHVMNRGNRKALIFKEKGDYQHFLEQVRDPWLAAWIAGTLYAATDDLHQLFVEGRSCEFRDVCIDSAGVVLGITIAAIANAIRSRKRSDRKGTIC